MKTLSTPSGRRISVLGQGTWGMGEHGAQQAREVAALRLGIDLGMTLIDTAEMYGDGGAETVVGAAIAGRRAEVFLVSKVYPHHADRQGVQAACERSLRRLGTDHLDLYLLHWRGAVPLAETLEAFAALQQAGKIRDYGVSNFDTADMAELHGWPHGPAVAVNQVLYNLAHRGAEWDLLPWCRQQGVPLMAYSPLESSAADQRRLLGNSGLAAVAERRQVKPAQVALAWLLQRDGVVVIPKAVDPAHVRANHGALGVQLDAEDLAQLDRAFPPPRRRTPLALR